MKKRMLGRTDMEVTLPGLGCMGMSFAYGATDDDLSRATLKRAFEEGVDFYDTADMYGSGHNEKLLAGFIADKRDKLILATKFGIRRKPDEYAREIDNRPEYVVEACDASLKRLGTDHIDLYYMHRRNPDVPVEDSVGAMSRLVEAGKVRAIGLSEVNEDTLRRAHAVHPITALQSEYSLWTRDPEENGVLGACRELGISFVAYSPLGRAFLTGTASDPTAFGKDDFRSILPRFNGEAAERNTALVDRLKAFAGDKDATPAQIALAWLVEKNDIVIPIPGTRREKYLMENIAAMDIALSADEIALLDGIFDPAAIAGDRYTEEGMKGVGR